MVDLPIYFIDFYMVKVGNYNRIYMDPTGRAISLSGRVTILRLSWTDSCVPCLQIFCAHQFP